MIVVDPGVPAVLAGEAALLFRDRHGVGPDVVARAPGRVNLVGDHTDYNGGPCLPVALPHATYAAVRTRDDGQVRLASTGGDGVFAAPLEETGPGRVSGWAAYAAGVLWALREAGQDVPGCDVQVVSTVPAGGGLSSSAALECAVAVAVTAPAGARAGSAPDRATRDRIVAACVRAEVEVAGAPTGGMDQTVAMHARAGTALLLDFGTGERRHVPCRPVAAGLELLVVDSGVRHALADGAYGERRAACERAAHLLGVPHLAAASSADLDRLDDPVLRRRARHVLSEGDRVRAAATALAGGDWAGLGTVMTASHASLRDDFEVSCPELDAIVSAALDAGALGARMTGGGFGGSAVVLCRAGDEARLAAVVDDALGTLGTGPASYLRLGEGGGAAAVCGP